MYLKAMIPTALGTTRASEQSGAKPDSPKAVVVFTFMSFYNDDDNKQPWVQHGASEQSEAKPGGPKAVGIMIFIC